MMAGCCAFTDMTLPAMRPGSQGDICNGKSGLAVTISSQPHRSADRHC
jgi:hypothetical protein